MRERPEPKHKIRKTTLRKRDALTGEATGAAARKIWSRLIKTSVFRNARHIMFYAAKGSEVPTLFMITKAIRLRKKVSVPKVYPRTGTLGAIIIRDPGKDLAPGLFGILEPKDTVKNKMAPDKLDLVITPGAVFDENLRRIGWGKGYYDRFLEYTARAVKIGIAYECQIVKSLAPEKHDIPMDMVITEKRIIRRRDRTGG